MPYKTVQEKVYEQAQKLCNQFGTFQNSSDDAGKTDCMLVFTIQEYGYYIQCNTIYIQSYIELSCRLIKNENVTLKEQSDFSAESKEYRQVRQYDALWKEKVESKGQTIDLEDLFNGESSLEKSIESACENAVRKLFATMHGIKMT